MGYLANFIVYTAAMTGVIFLAVFVYKKFSFTNVQKSNFLGVEDCINLAPRKNLYVVRAGHERFLVASDIDKTSLISKLEDTKDYKVNSEVEELPVIVDFQKKNSSKKIFKNIINNI